MLIVLLLIVIIMLLLGIYFKIPPLPRRDYGQEALDKDRRLREEKDAVEDK